MTKELQQELQALDRQIQQLHPSGPEEDLGEIWALLDKDYTKPEKTDPEPREQWLPEEPEEPAQPEAPAAAKHPEPARPQAPAKPEKQKPETDRFLPVMITAAVVQCMAIGVILALWLL